MRKILEKMHKKSEIWFGHIVNLVKGSSTDYVETICQIFYAVAIGLLLAAVLIFRNVNRE